MGDSPQGSFDGFPVYEMIENEKNKSKDLIKLSSVSDRSSDSGISEPSSVRKPTVGFVDKDDEREPGQTLSEAMRQGEFKETSKRKSQWGQYLMNVDMRKVLASGTFKLTLLQLARDGESETLEFLLRSLNKAQTRRMLNSTTDEEGATPLHLAAKSNHFEVCKKLIEAGASVNIRAGETRETPLHFAARIRPKRRTLKNIAEEVRGGLFKRVVMQKQRQKRQESLERDTSVILLLHRSGANVNDADIEGQSPLHCATIKGNFSCVQQLLECDDIQVDMKDSQGMTALHLAATHGYYNIVEALMKKGASLDAVDNDQMTPMHFACADGNVAVVRYILNEARKSGPGKARDMLLRPDAGKNTPLHIAVGKGHAAVVDEIIAFMQTPDDIKRLVTTSRSHGDTPVHIAAAQGFLDICDKLILSGADVDARNDSLATPLLLAAHHNNFEVIEFLHDRGSDLETRDKDNLTPLLLACKQGHLETLSWLIEHDADCNATDKHDKTCLMLAVEEQRTGAVHELLKYESIQRLTSETDKNTNSVLHIASKKGYLPIVRILLDYGIRLDGKNEDEATSIHIAAKYGQHIILKELLDHDKATINGVDENANTALHLASIEGHTKCVDTLIGHGANVALRNTRQMTPLDCACSKGWEATVRALIRAQAAINPIKGSRTTPLHEACLNGHPKVVNILLDSRADVTAKLSDGRNPLDSAIDQDEQECVEAILRHDCWKDALRNAYVDPVTVKMPEMAELAFTRSIKDNRKKWDSNDLELNLDFEFLDDMYTVTQWLHKEKELLYENLKLREANEDSIPGIEYKGTKEYDSMTTPLSMNGKFTIPEDPGSYEAFNDQGRLNGTAVTYTEDTNVLRHNHPLMIMVSTKRESLLQHPVVTALLQYKWNKYGGFVYYSSLCILIALVVLLNVYMLLIPPPYTVDFLKSMANRRFYKHFTDEHLTNYSAPKNCYSMLEQGATYRGYVNQSMTNQTCIEWSTTSTDSVLYPHAGLDKNYCRNPGSLLDKPWCFTNYSEERTEWIVREECDVPRCSVYVLNEQLPRGTLCHFPFIFGGVEHESCIAHPDGQWCAATANYDRDFLWGFCTEVDPYCHISKELRRPCGKPGIDRLNCEARACCFEVHNRGLPSEYSECFQKFSSCSDWNAYCEINAESGDGCSADWMQATCPKTCGICNETKEKEDSARRRFLYLMSTYPKGIFDPEWETGCYYCLPGAEKKWGTHCRYKGDWETVVKVVLIILCFFNLTRLLLQIWNYGWEAFKPIFLLELCLYVLCLLLVVDTVGFDLPHTSEMLNEFEIYRGIIDEFQMETGIRQNWQWQCGVSALFLSWMNLLLYIQKIPYLGIYVVMFNDIFKTFSKFSIVFLLFILSFAFTFHALLQNEIEFEFPFQSILKATVMMVGELDFTGIFLGGSEEYAEKVNYLILTYILFAIFIIVMMIIIMNLLVGLAVGDIMEVQQHATLERLKMQVELALEVEFSVPDIIRKRFVRKSATIRPNVFRGKNALTRAIFEDKSLSAKNISAVISSQKKLDLIASGRRTNNAGRGFPGAEADECKADLMRTRQHNVHQQEMYSIHQLISEGEIMQDTMHQMMAMVKELKAKSVDHDALLKDLLSETREMKSAVDSTADVQQQIMSTEDAKPTTSPVTLTLPEAKKENTAPSPVLMRSLIPAFMRSSSFRRGSTGARLRSSLRKGNHHVSTGAIMRQKCFEGEPLVSPMEAAPPTYENEVFGEDSEKLLIPEFHDNECEYEA